MDSNNVDDDSLSSLSPIQTFKAQGRTIEGSNRFLKDPRLYAESFFLRKESRIMALVTIMAMALPVILSPGSVPGKPWPP